MDKETLLDLYFENALDAEQQKLFKDLLENDASFLEEFTFQKQLKSAITLESRRELKEYLQQLEKKEPKSRKTFFFYAAAVITVLILLGSFIFSNFNSKNEDLFALYFEPYPNVVEPIVRNSNTSTLKSEAFLAYEQENFAQSALLFKDLASSTQEDYARFYEGISLMATENFEDAKKVFLTSTFDDEFEARKNWYLSLIYFKLNETDRALELLNQIIDSKSFNHKRAESLRNDIQQKK